MTKSYLNKPLNFDNAKVGDLLRDNRGRKFVVVSIDSNKLRLYNTANDTIFEVSKCGTRTPDGGSFLCGFKLVGYWVEPIKKDLWFNVYVDSENNETWTGCSFGSKELAEEKRTYKKDTKSFTVNVKFNSHKTVYE